MSFINYESNLLIVKIKSLLNSKSTGILRLKTNVTHWKSQRSCLLVFNQGILTFGETRLPTSLELCQSLQKISKSDIFDAALLVANNKIINPKSIYKKIMER